MARQNHGPLSRAKGKLGGVVYQQYEGMQIAREYQPVVKNPQTDPQVNNRAKFKNASQLLAIFKEAINLRFAKVSIYPRMRRAAAVSILYRTATKENDLTSNIDLTAAASAINGKSMTEYAAPTSTVSGSNYSVIAPANAKILGVIAGFDSTGKLAARKVVSATSTGVAVTFPLLGDVDSQHAMFLYAIATSEEGEAIFSNILASGNDFTITAMRLVNEGTVDVSDIATVQHSA